MIIKRLKLENIRSYSNQEINFSEGNTLLSGNIGSGKTSLLLAIDFALFGIRKGNLSGGALLRHGEDKGSVELNFEIDDKNIVIKRSLKRTKSGVSQDFGYIGIDDDNFEGTAIELKQRILELFNYPSEYLTKSKSLIYNYTIYTPQEEMKTILLTDSQERLGILRKVFGIDKYQRIMNNSKFLVTRLKSKRKEMEIRTSNLSDKINERDEKRARLARIKAEISEFESKKEKIGAMIISFRKKLEVLEEEKNKREILRKNILIVENNIRNLIENRARNTKLVEILQSEITSLESEVKNQEKIDLDGLNKRILDKEEDIRRSEVLLKDVLKKIHEAELKIRDAEKNKNNINELISCPYCRQRVDENHKKKIFDLEDIKIKENNELLDGVKIKEKDIEKGVDVLKKEVDELKKKRSVFELAKFKKESLEQKYKQLDELLNEQKGLKSKIGESNVKKSDFNSKLESIPDIDKEYSGIKKEMDEHLSLEKEILSKKAGFESELRIITKLIDNLNDEILNGEKIKSRIVEYIKLISWMERDFVNLVSLIERQIMMKVHSDFDSLFKDWFGILVGDETLKIRLDRDFTPLILQNGYDADYLHLSGGEKTAAALAYRLSLNQVINTVMSDINTRDLLILDEPTDGFSEEQVDKIRLILEELGVKQVIIVSHDPKIESFVDHVIKFEKVSGETSVF